MQDELISRQAVLDYIYSDLGLGDEENGKDVERLMELESSYKYVKSLPPVTPNEEEMTIKYIEGYNAGFCHAQAIFQKEPKTGHCKDCKHFRKLPHLADTLGKCVHDGGFCHKGDWYCADFEPRERREEK